MRIKVLLVVTLLLAIIVSCSTSTFNRAEKPAFKGMELYSWKPDGKDWHFSLLLGTNRLKSDDEKMKPKQKIVGIEELKKHLARLAEGESVFWVNLAKEPFPEEMIEDLKKYCNGINVNLVL